MVAKNDHFIRDRTIDDADGVPSRGDCVVLFVYKVDGEAWWRWTNIVGYILVTKATSLPELAKG